VVSCVGIGNFDEADMTRVLKRPGGNGHNRHGLVIVRDGVECRINAVRMEALVLTGSLIDRCVYWHSNI